MYVERNIAALSRNDRYHGNSTVVFPCIVDITYVTGNNIISIDTVAKTQNCVIFIVSVHCMSLLTT